AEQFVRQLPVRLIGDNAYESHRLDVDLARCGVELIAPHRRTLGRMWLMGNLFPGDPEYPDHRRIPSPAAEAVTPVLASVVMTASLQALFPGKRHDAIHDHVHVPHHEFVQGQPLLALSVDGSSSSSGDPLTWRNSSMMDAANMVI